MMSMNNDHSRSMIIADAMNIDRYDHWSYWFMHECAVHAMKGYWSCMKTVDHSYEQALIMHDNVHIHVIMNIIMTPTWPWPWPWPWSPWQSIIITMTRRFLSRQWKVSTRAFPGTFEVLSYGTWIIIIIDQITIAIKIMTTWTHAPVLPSNFQSWKGHLMQSPLTLDYNQGEMIINIETKLL